MQITEIERFRILLDRAESLNQIHTNFICELMLKGKVSIEDIPYEIRTSEKSIYITAFRCAGNNLEMSGKTLYLLRNDIEHMERSEQIEEFMSLYMDYEAERLARIERCRSPFPIRGWRY